MLYREYSASAHSEGGPDASVAFDGSRGDRPGPARASGPRAVALDADCRRLGSARTGNTGASDLLSRPSLPAASQRPSLAGRVRGLPAVLANHDGGHDVALEYADGQTGGVCRS